VSPKPCGKKEKKEKKEKAEKPAEKHEKPEKAEKPEKTEEAVKPPRKKPGPKPKNKERKAEEAEEEKGEDLTKRSDYAPCPFCTGTDQDDMVQCDKCEAWIHSGCAGLSEDDLVALDEDDEVTTPNTPSFRVLPSCLVIFVGFLAGTSPLTIALRCSWQEFVCFMCKTRAEQKKGPEGGDDVPMVDDTAGDGLWQCAACTYAENHENLLACMICDTMRGVSGARALLSRNRMPDSASGGMTGAHAIRRIRVPEGKRMLMAFAMCFAQPNKPTCDSLRLRSFNQVFPGGHAVGVAEYESNQHGEPRAGSPNLAMARPDSVPEGEDRTHIAADFRQTRGFATIMDQAPGAMMMLDYFWLEKDYYHNRYGDKWVSAHLEAFFKKGLVPNDPMKVAILPVDAPHSGNMLDMLSSSAMPHTKDQRIASCDEPTACLTKKLKALGVFYQFMTRKTAEQYHPLVVATLDCEPELKQIDAGRIHKIQIERCDPDTPFVVFFRQERPEETHIEAIRRVCGEAAGIRPRVASPIASSPKRVLAKPKELETLAGLKREPPAPMFSTMVPASKATTPMVPASKAKSSPVVKKASTMPEKKTPGKTTPSKAAKAAAVVAVAGNGSSAKLPLSKKAMLMQRMMGGGGAAKSEDGEGEGKMGVEVKQEVPVGEADTDASADGSPTYSESTEDVERRRKNEASEVAVTAS